MPPRHNTTRRRTRDKDNNPTWASLLLSAVGRRKNNPDSARRVWAASHANGIPWRMALLRKAVARPRARPARTRWTSRRRVDDDDDLVVDDAEGTAVLF